MFRGRPVVPGRPLWLDEDQDEILGYRKAIRSVHYGCGTRREDWLDENGREIIPPPFTAVAISCPGCKELDRERRELEADKRMTPDVDVVLVPYDPQRDEAEEYDDEDG